MQLLQSIERRNMPSSESKTTGTPKSSSTREIEKSGMADHKWKEKRNYQPLLNKVKMIDREGHEKKKILKEAAHLLDHVDLLSRPPIEMNTVWEPIIEKAKLNCF